ncbi:MAG: hypothetical protein E7D19_15600 [Klebsiella grimontii]|nr:hypothetical protein [Klebsiella grimontii]
MRILVCWGGDVEQTLHQRRHHVFVIRQRRDLLRRRAWPMDHQGNLQLLARPAKLLMLRVQRHSAARRHDHHRVVQLARFAQRVQHTTNLRIDRTGSAAVATDKVLLLPVVKGGAVERNP